MAEYIEQKPAEETLEVIADFICGDNEEKFPVYRSSFYLTKFFKNIGINVEHDGSTRKKWVLEVLESLSINEIEEVILRLVDIKEYKGDIKKLKQATKAMNEILFIEDLKLVFQGKIPSIVKINSHDNPLISNKEKEQAQIDNQGGIFANNLENNGYIISDSDNKLKKSEEATLSWPEKWWAKYLLFPIFVLVISALIIWYLGIN
jgi:hypothetical protein